MDNGGTRADAGAVGKLAAPVLAAVTLAPLFLTAQMLVENATGPLVIIDILIDALM